MPNLMGRVQRLTQQPPPALLIGERCLSERDLNAGCTVCADVCPAGAIVLEGDSGRSINPYGPVSKDQPTGPRLDVQACTYCGRCVVACPTAAFAGLPPYDDGALLDACQRAAMAASAQTPAAKPSAEAELPAETSNVAGSAETPIAIAGFACAETAQALRIDAERAVVLPCLAWIDGALLLHIACAGAQKISVLTCNCATCEQAAAVDALPTAVANAQAIADVWGMEATFQVVECGDGGLAAAEAPAAGEVSRRDLLLQARSAATNAATEAAASPIRDLIGLESAEHAHEPEPDRRRWQLLDNLHAFGLPHGGAAVAPRSLAPRVDIDADRCSGCALCAQFCPTGALRKAGKAAGGKTVLEFDAALCRDCGICVKTCRYEALSCEETLTAAELFALEPHQIIIPKRRVLPSRR